MNKKTQKKTYCTFLKDVSICALGSYGGPEAHFGVFNEQLAIKKNYVSEEEIAELIALTSILPGPSSTQAIVAIGYKIGGPLLGLLTMLVWALPPILIMCALSFVNLLLHDLNIAQNILRYIAPMAVGFILVAAFRLTKKVATNNMRITLVIFSAVATYLIREPWIFPTVLIIGGIVSVLHAKEKNLWNKTKLSPPWIYLILFVAFILLSIVLSTVFDSIFTYLFHVFYRFGYLVIGGGQVVIPLMLNELVEVGQHMSSEQFLTGYGLVQGLPGPMFSFASYAGGIAASSGGTLSQILGSLIAGISIFLPGVLLIYFVYPIWDKLKQMKGIRISLNGISAVAAGLLISSAMVLLQNNGFALDTIVIVILSTTLLFTKKVPAPIIVLLMIVLGFII